ncbi:MAG: redoxin domain-containing protein [Thermoleophilaceae bacterium]|nr:redoxin domain-containing protein [Thermoleophilaceae bacterium]
MRPPPGLELPAPEFPKNLEWVNVASLRMDQQLGQGAVLVEFWDFARVNSHRTLPYMRAWHERYEGDGLRVIGVHTPGYSFGSDPDLVRAAVARLEMPYAIALDPHGAVWRAYGNEGWPGRWLFDQRGVLRFFHYGEGEYRETELAIQDLLAGEDHPDPVEPVRPEDAPGALMEPQTADIALPGGRDRLELGGDWTDGPDYIEAGAPGATATASFRAGSAWAVLSGTVEPGLHETDGRVRAEQAGLRLHGFQFTPIPPLTPG